MASCRVTAFGARGCDRFQQRCGIVRAGHCSLAVEDEKRYAADAYGARFPIFGFDVGPAGRRCEQSTNFGLWKTGVACDLDQLLRVGEHPTFDEVGTEQTFDQRVRRLCITTLLRPRDQSMRIERIRLSVNAIEIERNANAGAGGADTRVDFGRTCLAAEFGFDIRGASDTLGWQVGIELKGMPAANDGKAGFARVQLCQRRLELALADVAPRADDVGNDIDDKFSNRRFRASDRFSHASV